MSWIVRLHYSVSIWFFDSPESLPSVLFKVKRQSGIPIRIMVFAPVRLIQWIVRVKIMLARFFHHSILREYWFCVVRLGSKMNDEPALGLLTVTGATRGISHWNGRELARGGASSGDSWKNRTGIIYPCSCWNSFTVSLSNRGLSKTVSIMGSLACDIGSSAVIPYSIWHHSASL